MMKNIPLDGWSKANIRQVSYLVSISFYMEQINQYIEYLEKTVEELKRYIRELEEK